MLILFISILLHIYNSVVPQANKPHNKVFKLRSYLSYCHHFNCYLFACTCMYNMYANLLAYYGYIKNYFLYKYVLQAVTVPCYSRMCEH